MANRLLQMRIEDNHSSAHSGPVPNIIIFGESGSGKSSLVNMIAGSNVADTSNGATGCTFEYKAYKVTFMSSTFNLYDTAGLDEGDEGKVPKKDAIIQLYRLLKRLSSGVSLLIFCMRGPRIKGSAQSNWSLFHEIMCDKKVPIIIVVTGLEHETVMDEWWYENKGAFQSYGMNPAGFACITATRGKMVRPGVHKFDEEYEESKQKMWKVIKATHLAVPWTTMPVEWFSHIVNVTYESRWCKKPIKHEKEEKVPGRGVEMLTKLCGMTEKEAVALAKELEEV